MKLFVLSVFPVSMLLWVELFLLFLMFENIKKFF